MPLCTTTVALGAITTTPSRYSSRVRSSVPEMPMILLPLPRASIGSSATGNTSMRPSLLTATSSSFAASCTRTGASTCAASGSVSTALPARFLVCRSSSFVTKP